MEGKYPCAHRGRHRREPRLGFETCRQFALLGVTVLLTTRDAARGETAAAALRTENLDVRFYPLDVTCGESVRTLARFIEREYGRLDILVNNADVLLDPFEHPAWEPHSALEADSIRYAPHSKPTHTVRCA